MNTDTNADPKDRSQSTNGAGLILEKVRLLEENAALKAQQTLFWKQMCGRLGFVVFGLVLCLLLAIFSFRAQRTVPIGITPNGVVIPITPLSTNNINPQTVATLARDAFVDTNWVGFVNTEGSIEAKRQWFDGVDGGFASWRESIRRTGFVDRIRNNQEVASAALLSAPVIQWSGPHPQIKGVFAWKVQFSALISYTGAKGTATQNVRVEMLMRRVPETSRLEGVAVEAIITT